MAEAAAVVGLVASIASLIDLSAKIVLRINEFNSQASEVPQSFRSLASRLPLLSLTLQHIQTRARANQIQDGVAKELDKLVSDILGQVNILQQYLDRVIPATSASRLERTLKGAQSLFKDEKVRKVVEKLHHSIDILTLYQSTKNSELGDRILQELTQLKLSSISAHQPQKTFGLCIGQAPHLEADAFIGRETEVQTLHDWLLPETPSQTQKVVSIVGMGGLGKTQLSLAYIRKYGHNYSSVFWVNAKDQSSLRQSISKYGTMIFPDKMTVPDSVVNEGVQVEEVRQWLSESWNYRWLIVFDNYDDPSLPNVYSSTGFDVRSFFPLRAQGSVLITTRNPKLTFTKRLVLQKLGDIGLGVKILSQRSGQDMSHDEYARRLATRLDGLPLALATAGTYLGQANASSAEYLEAYESAWTDLHGPDVETLLEYERTLSSTWTISINYVEAQDGDATNLFQFFAMLGNQDIWYNLIQGGVEHEPAWIGRVTATKIRFDRAMAKLRDYSLIEIVTGSYRIHPCIHDWLLERLTKTMASSLFPIALKCIISNIADESDIEHWKKNSRLIQHIQRLEHPRFRDQWEACMSNEIILEYCHTFGELCHRQTRLPEAEQMYVRAFVGKKQLLGPEHISTLKSASTLCNVYSDQGKDDEADIMYSQTIARKEKVFGAEHISTLRTISDLGSHYLAQDKLEEAEHMYLKAIAGKERVLGSEHSSTL